MREFFGNISVYTGVSCVATDTENRSCDEGLSGENNLSAVSLVWGLALKF